VTEPSQSQQLDLTPVAGSGKGPFLSTRDQKYCRMSASVGPGFTPTLLQQADYLPGYRTALQRCTTPVGGFSAGDAGSVRQTLQLLRCVFGGIMEHNRNGSGCFRALVPT
jgi:hypothetical protein